MRRPAYLGEKQEGAGGCTVPTGDPRSRPGKPSPVFQDRNQAGFPSAVLPWRPPALLCQQKGHAYKWRGRLGVPGRRRSCSHLERPHWQGSLLRRPLGQGREGLGTRPVPEAREGLFGAVNPMSLRRQAHKAAVTAVVELSGHPRAGRGWFPDAGFMASPPCLPPRQPALCSTCLPEEAHP